MANRKAFITQQTPSSLRLHRRNSIQEGGIISIYIEGAAY